MDDPGHEKSSIDSDGTTHDMPPSHLRRGRKISDRYRIEELIGSPDHFRR